MRMRTKPSTGFRARRQNRAVWRLLHAAATSAGRNECAFPIAFVLDAQHVAHRCKVERREVAVILLDDSGARADKLADGFKGLTRLDEL
jgi:hypothetical protein